MAYLYCSRCGLTGTNSGDDLSKERCGYCGFTGTCKLMPNKYLINGSFNNDMEDEFFEECLKKSEAFDYQLYKNRTNKTSDYNHTKQSRTNSASSSSNNYNNQLPIAPSSMSYRYSEFIPRCITCKCNNIRRISFIERLISICTFGVLSNSFNKTFQCNNCGYKW